MKQFIRSALAAHQIESFVTDESDIEGYFVNAQHLAHLNPSVTIARMEELITEATNDTRQRSIEAIVNLRTQEAFRKRNQGGAVLNHGAIAVAASSDYDAAPATMRQGKKVLGRLKALIQQEIGHNAVVVGVSPHAATVE
jgi:hypothetical protein